MANKKHELPVYSIFMHPQDLRELKRDIWCDEPLPAKLKIGKRHYEIDIVYRGSHIRKWEKKSYDLFFIKPAAFLGGASACHLNAEYIDRSLIRNKLSMDFFADLGVLAPRSRHVLVTLNGSFQGVYLQLESVDEQFLVNRELPQGPIYYAVDDDANFSLMSPLDTEIKKEATAGYERKCGTKADDDDLRDLIYKINTIPKAEFGKEIQKFVHVDHYLRWLTGIVCTQNFDGFIHNYALYRNSETGLFEMIPWDFDATWGRDINGREMEPDFIPIQGYNTLTARLLDDAGHRRVYRRLLEKTLEHEFTVDYFTPKIEHLHNLLRPHVLNDPYIKENINIFDKEPEFIQQFIIGRNHYLKDHLGDLD
ncbi:CotH kinase family protein [Camelliibacillus cellulosilyticus]|uniref:CotH kinase family protein n=1 Tax=Camelliibacillus cellulosilyticus TaxID=2174486 RepID=A0ABV9GU61_9BACL